MQAAVADGLAVHTGVVPLAQARAISGLRTVLGEAAPDPARVVSVGVPVAELLTSRPGSGGASVELCGGTHMRNTSQVRASLAPRPIMRPSRPAASAVPQARAFALLDETSIGQGVRRVVGVTGDAAVAALARGEELRAALSAATPAGGERQALLAARAKLAAVRSALAEAAAPVHVRGDLRAEIEAREKALTASFRQLARALLDRCVEDAVEAAAAAAGSGARFAVVELPAGLDDDAKAPQKIAKRVGKEAPGLALLALSAAADGGKLVCFAAVPAELQAQLPAGDWLRAALEPCGGRGGGRPTLAQGTAPNVAAAGVAVAAARVFAQSALEPP